MSDQENPGFIGAGHLDPELSLTPLALVPESLWEHPGEIVADFDTYQVGSFLDFILDEVTDFPAWHPPVDTHYMAFISGELWNSGVGNSTLTFGPDLYFGADPPGLWTTLSTNDGTNGWSGLMGASYIGYGPEVAETWLLGLGLKANAPGQVKARKLKIAIYRFQ